MIPLMLVFGTLMGLVAIGGFGLHKIAMFVTAGAIVWGAAVGAVANSWAVALGGAVLGAVNAAVGFAVVWAISWPVRQRRPD
jgi:hypothetical protein